ncbi:YicC family protein [Marivivens niveibacter]|uniref:YicC family protein n=2 Tax=Marivivens niveibacter TaxID=1930667 RepID=A0A251X4I3_9RHOB|nr:YicC family protein [Marivivens niveibacter]
MTAFASRTSQIDGANWVWDIRSVNARGIDVRVRVPDGFSALEQIIRQRIAKTCARGNISLTLRMTADNTQGAVEVDQDMLARVIAASAVARAQAEAAGIQISPPTALDFLNVKGVMVPRQDKAEDTDKIIAALTHELDGLLNDFAQMRKTEGTALHSVLTDQLSTIEALVDQAAKTADERQPHMAASLKSALSRVMSDVDAVDPDRLAQELALIAVKQDVTEEIDRLRAHVDAARLLVNDLAPSGRKLDFLAQEFNREANTLCSKSQFRELTAVGLDLKAAIEQMREQIQNVE